MTIHAGGFRRQSTEALIAAAIRYFREQPERIQQALIDMEVVVQAHPGPNPCAEIVLDRPVEPDLGGDHAAQIQESKYGDRQMPKEPGQRAYEAFREALSAPRNPRWAKLTDDGKAPWIAAEKACQPVIEPIMTEDCYIGLDELMGRMKLLKGRWKFVTSSSDVAFTNLPEQALACLIGMKAEITAFEAQFAPNPDHQELSEADGLLIEAAEFHGFTPLDDEATVYRVFPHQIVTLMRVARKQGRDDVKALDALRAERQEVSDQLIEKLSSKPAQYGHDEGLRRRTTRIVEINDLIKEIMTNG